LQHHTEMDGFLMYRADQDTNSVIFRIKSVVEWPDERGHEHARPHPFQEQLEHKQGSDETDI
jgi:hypothetical protein